MRLIQTLVPEGKHDIVVDILEREGVQFAMSTESSAAGYSDIVSIPVDADGVERIVDELRSVGVECEGYMIVTEAETIISERFEETPGQAERISRHELRTKARNLSCSTTNYLALTVISAVVATAGLLEDSAAVVVGSMVIAPLIGPAMASCVGTVIDDGSEELFRNGVRSQAIGLAVAVASATVFALAYRVVLAPDLDLLLIQQVAERAHPGLLALAIALGAGAAGALSLTSGADEALVGVMIAVALIPPAASVGLGIAYADPRLAVGAGVLVFVNVLSINFAGILTLWIKRYKPSHREAAEQVRRVTISRLAVVGLVILVLTSFLAVSSHDARENAAFETDVETIAEATTDELLAVDIDYRADLTSQQPTDVTVRAAGDDPPTAGAIHDQIRTETGVSVPVTVVTERVDTT